MAWIQLVLYIENHVTNCSTTTCVQYHTSQITMLQERCATIYIRHARCIWGCNMSTKAYTLSRSWFDSHTVWIWWYVEWMRYATYPSILPLSVLANKQSQPHQRSPLFLFFLMARQDRKSINTSLRNCKNPHVLEVSNSSITSLKNTGNKKL